MGGICHCDSDYSSVFILIVIVFDVVVVIRRGERCTSMRASCMETASSSGGRSSDAE
jgi:hypothetical protein